MVFAGWLRFVGLRSRKLPSKMKKKLHIQPVSFYVSLLSCLEFTVCCCDFCNFSFLLGCLGLNYYVAVFSKRSVDHLFDVHNATFLWIFFHILLGWLLNVNLRSFHCHPD